MLYGPLVIDVQDWKKNTAYKGYQHDDPVIVWFWEIVLNLDQTKLSNLLHYVTGSNRVPILGFKFLESNRGQYARFLI